MKITSRTIRSVTYRRNSGRMDIIPHIIPRLSLSTTIRLWNEIKQTQTIGNCETSSGSATSTCQYGQEYIRSVRELYALFRHQESWLGQLGMH